MQDRLAPKSGVGNAGYAIIRLLGVALAILLIVSAPLSAVSPDDARRDFEAVQKIHTREAYEAFLKQYPEGLYAGLAREELKKLGALAFAQLVRAVNFELARVGCAPNAAGDEWTVESQAALAQFNVHAKTRLDLNKVDGATLAALQEKSGRVCPLLCGANERVERDTCVAVAPPPAAPNLPPPAEKKKQAAPAAARKWCLANRYTTSCNFDSEAQCRASVSTAEQRCLQL